MLNFKSFAKTVKIRHSQAWIYLFAGPPIWTIGQKKAAGPLLLEHLASDDEGEVPPLRPFLHHRRCQVYFSVFFPPSS
jgi:hypothetical protein